MFYNLGTRAKALSHKSFIPKLPFPIIHNSIASCKFGNFRENFIFANSVKRHICVVENSRLGHD